MSVQFTKEEIFPLISNALHAVMSASKDHSLRSNVLLSIEGNCMALTGCSETYQIKHKGVIDSPTGDSFCGLLPAKKLHDIVKLSDQGQLFKLEIKGEKALLRAGKSRYQLSYFSDKDFPLMKNEKVNAGFFIDPVIFENLIDTGLYAVGVNDTRQYLNGLCFELNANQSITVIATNGFVLAKNHYETITKGEPCQVIVPTMTLKAIKKAFHDENKTAKFLISEGSIYVEGESIELTSKLIDGNFPDYNRVIPSTLPHHITIDRNSLRSALQRANIFSQDDRLGAIDLLLDKGEMGISVAGDKGSSEDKILLDYQGDAICLRLKLEFLSKTIATLCDEFIHMNFGSVSDPVIVLQGEKHSQNTKRLHVIMPIRQ